MQTEQVVIAKLVQTDLDLISNADPLYVFKSMETPLYYHKLQTQIINDRDGTEAEFENQKTQKRQVKSNVKMENGSSSDAVLNVNKSESSFAKL